MPINSYQDALDFWYGRINYERTGMPGRRNVLKLDRMRLLLHQLGSPQRNLRVIHIAGSKGKGSTAAMVASILQCSGYRTGLFTSPHLVRVEERIQIDGVAISSEELTQLMSRIEGAVAHVEKTMNQPVTFFEIVTALGLLHFCQQQVDFAILEVGLGGRFDATNVCEPLISIITSISLDHTKQLGSCISDIAFEKAGIIKPSRPVIAGVEQFEAAQVIHRAADERGSPIRHIDRDFTYVYQPGRIAPEEDRPSRLQVTTWARDWPWIVLSLLGDHQAANATVAIATVEQLNELGFDIGLEAVARGLRCVQWPARMEVFSRQPYVVLDCAHNTASVQVLVDTLKSCFPGCQNSIIFAVSDDKDVGGMVKILAGHFDQALMTRFSSSPRAVDPVILASVWRQFSDGPVESFVWAADAWHAAIELAEKDSLICIAGSVFLAGELRPILLESVKGRNQLS